MTTSSRPRRAGTDDRVARNATRAGAPRRSARAHTAAPSTSAGEAGARPRASATMEESAIRATSSGGRAPIVRHRWRRDRDVRRVVARPRRALTSERNGRALRPAASAPSQRTRSRFARDAAGTPRASAPAVGRGGRRPREPPGLVAERRGRPPLASAAGVAASSAASAAAIEARAARVSTRGSPAPPRRAPTARRRRRRRSRLRLQPRARRASSPRPPRPRGRGDRDHAAAARRLVCFRLRRLAHRLRRLRCRAPPARRASRRRGGGASAAAIAASAAAASSARPVRRPPAPPPRARGRRSSSPSPDGARAAAAALARGGEDGGRRARRGAAAALAPPPRARRRAAARAAAAAAARLSASTAAARGMRHAASSPSVPSAASAAPPRRRRRGGGGDGGGGRAGGVGARGGVDLRRGRASIRAAELLLLPPPRSRARRHAAAPAAAAAAHRGALDLSRELHREADGGAALCRRRAEAAAAPARGALGLAERELDRFHRMSVELRLARPPVLRCGGAAAPHLRPHPRPGGGRRRDRPRLRARDEVVLRALPPPHAVGVVGDRHREHPRRRLRGKEGVWDARRGCGGGAGRRAARGGALCSDASGERLEGRARPAFSAPPRSAAATASGCARRGLRRRGGRGTGAARARPADLQLDHLAAPPPACSAARAPSRGPRYSTAYPPRGRTGSCASCSTSAAPSAGSTRCRSALQQLGVLSAG